MIKIFLSLLFLFALITPTLADVVYLKNGFNIECIIRKEDEEVVELAVEDGTIRFKKSDVQWIYRASPEELEDIHKKWEEGKLEWQNRKQELEKREVEDKDKRKTIPLSQKAGHIMVDALLNDSFSVSLLLDTGASLVVLPSAIGKKLGIDNTRQERVLQMTLADGSKINAGYVVLKSVRVEGVEAKDVDAAILLEDVEDTNFKDGMLGMSFLKRFNFKVDQKNKKLILERLE